MLDLDKTKGAMGILSALAGAFSAIRKLLARDAPAQTVSSDRSPGAHLNNSGQITLTHSTLNVTTSQAKQWVPAPQWELKTTGYGGIRGDWNCKIQADNLGGVGHGVEVSEKESGFFRRYGSIWSGGKLTVDLNEVPTRNGLFRTLRQAETPTLNAVLWDTVL